jgi:hypothetical protein
MLYQILGRLKSDILADDILNQSGFQDQGGYGMGPGMMDPGYDQRNYYRRDNRF